MKERFLEVVSVDTGEVIHRVEVTSKSDNAVERVMRGMLINMSDRYVVRDTADA